MKVTIRHLVQGKLLHVNNQNIFLGNLLRKQSSILSIENNSSDFFGINDQSSPCNENVIKKTLAEVIPKQKLEENIKKHSTFQSHFGTIRIESLPQSNQQISKNATNKNNLPKNFLNPLVISDGYKAAEDLENLSQNSNISLNRENISSASTTKVQEESSQPIHQAKVKEKESLKTSNKAANTSMAKNIPVQKSDNRKAYNEQRAIDVVKELRKNDMKKSVDTSKSKPSEGFVGIRPLGFKKDAKGFNNFINQVQNWNAVPRYQVVDELRKNIIYEDDNILGINKPYGLSVMGDKKNLYSVHSLSPDLVKDMRLKCEQLHVVHRLDKDSTGVLILAKNAVTQARINGMFRQRLVQKVYWAITVGVPDRPEGIIDIPLVEKEFNGIHKIFVAPIYDEKGRVIDQNTPLTPESDAKTEFEILRRTSSAALLKLQTRTGFKHQIRVHLAYGLNCPILGDHKYSHLNEMKPQRLPTSMLDKLHVRQAKVRTLPLHLHAFSLILPSLEGDPNKKRLASTIEIAAPKLPFHFNANMKSLGLSITKD